MPFSFKIVSDIVVILFFFIQSTGPVCALEHTEVRGEDNVLSLIGIVP